MATQLAAHRDSDTALEHVDVLIVGAGVSGIGAAWHLQRKQPGKTYAILESRDTIGGTWDLFRYPGIRSDSDLHTFGYEFKPWTDEKAIADGPAIKAYIEETADENGIRPHIRFNHRVISADWDSSTARWTVTAERTDTGETVQMTAGWLVSAAGYYRYDEGYTPHFEGRERFQGDIIHPQHWPEDYDYSGKRIIVIGSGATAVTLVPALTDKAEHVVMLQRSPTYIVPLPSKDRFANTLRRLIGEERAYPIIRYKNVFRQLAFYNLCQRFPRVMRKVIRAMNKKALGGAVDVDVHFKPKYNPWDQRLCVVPDADLYRALRKGKASIVTDTIETFTERGIKLTSGRELEADVIVTATGLNLLTFGGIKTTIDGKHVHPRDTIAYKGMMLSGVPNFVFAVGYTNSSWTLKVDLVFDYMCRLIGECDRRGADAVVPEPSDPNMETRPLLDFQANYVLRALDDLPRQGTKYPWYLSMNYLKDRWALRRGRVDDGEVRFFSRTVEPAEDVAVAA
jgi:cation diffusion facilitator CzcD-associated flavoprotein CzcO